MSDQRVTELEIKVAYLEHTLEELDGVVRDLGATVDAMQRELSRLRATALESQEKPPIEKPPHY